MSSDVQDLPNRTQHVLEDPSAKAIAKSYALAFLDAAKEKGDFEALSTLTSFIDDVLDPNPKFEQLLVSPLTGRDNRLAILERSIIPQVGPVVANFLRVLSKHDRFEIIRVVVDQAWRENERREGKKRVIVKTAQPLGESELAAVGEKIKTAFDFEPVIQPETDPNMIGGLIVQVGDTVYDSSLRTRLNSLKVKLRERFANEIQGGRDRFSSPEGD